MTASPTAVSAARATRADLRNLAIVAHVDHGKTTLVDALLRQTGAFRANQAVVDLLIGADGSGLFEKCVDERGLAVVDVSDDGNVADVVSKLLHARALTPETVPNSSGAAGFSRPKQVT